MKKRLRSPRAGKSSYKHIHPTLPLKRECIYRLSVQNFRLPNAPVFVCQVLFMDWGFKVERSNYYGLQSLTPSYRLASYLEHPRPCQLVLCGATVDLCQHLGT